MSGVTCYVCGGYFGECSCAEAAAAHNLAAFYWPPPPPNPPPAPEPEPAAEPAPKPRVNLGKQWSLDRWGRGAE